MKNNLKTKIIAFLALFGILISVIGTGALIVYESYFNENINNQMNLSSEWENFINSMSEDEVQDFLQELDDNDIELNEFEGEFIQEEDFSQNEQNLDIESIEIENEDNL